MSIRLRVEDYCHSCLNFEADVEKDVIRDIFTDEPVNVATYIYCQHRDICKNLCNHLKNNKGGDKE